MNITGVRTRNAHRIAAVAAVATFLAACGGGGSSAPPPPATVTISVQPTTVVLGQTATLSWTATNGSACTATGGWSGTKSASGSAPVTPTATGSSTYTITCDGASGYSVSAPASVTLSVTAPSAFSTTSLVADTGGTSALKTDPNLRNAWGIVFGPTTPVWTANNATNTSTLYNGNGNLQPTASPLVVRLAASVSGTPFAPTGIVFNSTTDFVVAAAGKSGAARFIYAGEGGMIAGWASAVDATNAINVYTATDGAAYKGLAIANDGSGNFLYAADFRRRKIDVFNASYVKQVPTATRFAFTDPNLPSGYSPFNIQALKTGTGGATQLWVAYARQSAADDKENDNGAGLGVVDVYDTSGVLVRRFLGAGGLLNAPWGLALAPADFGTLSNAVLVGNFGDGKINAFAAATGSYVGTVANSSGGAFAVPGLWGIAFGNDAANQPHNTLFYAAGNNNENNGVYGRIDLGATPPVLNAPPVATVTAPTGTVSGTVTVTATATGSIAISRVQLFANATSLGTVTTSPYSVQWDTTTVANGSYSLTARATDSDGNVGTSAAVTVTVSNATAVTLSTLQSTVFTPRCAVCHNGAGSDLPGSMNLRSGNTYAAIVNVASSEQPSLLRVKPGDPANSYLIRKLEGTAGIDGVRMPANGPPYLDQATIDQIKSWITNGAPNN